MTTRLLEGASINNHTDNDKNSSTAPATNTTGSTTTTNNADNASNANATTTTADHNSTVSCEPCSWSICLIYDVFFFVFLISPSMLRDRRLQCGGCIIPPSMVRWTALTVSITRTLILYSRINVETR